MPSSTNKMISIYNILYLDGDKKVILYFHDAGNERFFSADVKRNGDIKLVSSDELNSFLMELMPYDPFIFKKLHKIIWDCIDGRPVALPIQLIPC